MTKRSEGQLLLDLLSDRPVAYHPSLARLLGSVNAAIMLSQLLYWTGRQADPEGWIFKDHHEWTEETGLSRHEQYTARKKLCEAGLLEEERRKGNALYFRVKREAVAALFTKGQKEVEPEPEPEEVPKVEQEEAPDEEPGEEPVVRNCTSRCAESYNSIPETTPETISYRDAARSPPGGNGKNPHHRAMFSLLAAFSKIDTKSKRNCGWLNKEVRDLWEAGHGLDHLEIFREWWLSDEWRRENCPHPGPNKVRERMLEALEWHAEKDGPTILDFDERKAEGRVLEVR